MSAKVRKEIHDFFPYKISTTTTCYYTNNRMNFKLTSPNMTSNSRFNNSQHTGQIKSQKCA